MVMAQFGQCLKIAFDTGYSETSRLGLVSLKSRTFRGSRPSLGSGIVNFKKRDRTRYRYRSPKKIETGLGLGIVNFKKTRPDSVSVSFTLKKRDQTRYRYRSI